MKIRKHILYILFLLLLAAPMIEKFSSREEEPLKGAFFPQEKPSFSWKTWFDGSFQADFEKFINDRMGFHNDLVRYRNEFCFRVFHQVNAKAVLQGKDDYLFEHPYIFARFGQDYIGMDSIRKNIRLIQWFQDEMTSRGKTFAFILAPSKADFFPEYIPDKYVRPLTDSTNYRQYIQLLRKSNIHYVDFNRWFIEKKGKTPHPLYPKYGIHWSYYASLHATDSLIGYLEKLMKRELPHIIIDGEVVSDTAQHLDYDIGETMNLITKELPGYPLCYPSYHWGTVADTTKPNMLVIADSYYWEVFNTCIQQHCFTGDFWFYNNSVYPASFYQETHVKDLNLKKAIEQADVILILCTTPALSDFSWGFLQSAKKVL